MAHSSSDPLFSVISGAFHSFDGNAYYKKDRLEFDNWELRFSQSNITKESPAVFPDDLDIGDVVVYYGKENDGSYTVSHMQTIIEKISNNRYLIFCANNVPPFNPEITVKFKDQKIFDEHGEEHTKKVPRAVGNESKRWATSEAGKWCLEIDEDSRKEAINNLNNYPELDNETVINLIDQINDFPINFNIKVFKPRK